jgi:hypothetical protein
LRMMSLAEHLCRSRAQYPPLTRSDWDKNIRMGLDK